jgi:protein gp37
MGTQTKIQWADDTWNPWIGCTKVSLGCQKCYAAVATPTRMFGVKWGKGAPRRRSGEATFNAPLRWNAKSWVCEGCGEPFADALPGSYGAHERKIRDPITGKPKTTVVCIGLATHGFHRRRVFSLSLGDWLDDEVPIKDFADMLQIITQCREINFLLLTKRPENWEGRLRAAHENLFGRGVHWIAQWIGGNPPPNCWIGVSVENQETADERIPKLLEIPAVIRFISYEPILGKVDFVDWLGEKSGFDGDGIEHTDFGIDWIICGGESGAGARPCNINWLRSTAQQCKQAGVACFVKQLGAKPFALSHCDIQGMEAALSYSMHPSENQMAIYPKLADKKGGDINEFPEDLRVREFPKDIREGK